VGRGGRGREEGGGKREDALIWEFLNGAGKKKTEMKFPKRKIEGV